MNTLALLLACAILVMNLVAFFLYWADKKKAQKGAWRISENTLIGVAACFGALGAFLAMRVFRHKTQHTKFTVCVPLFLALQLVLIAAGVYFLL